MSISSAADTPANRSPKPADGSATATPDTSGPSCPTPFAFYDPDGRSWKTSQGTLPWGSGEYLETWPRSGTTRSGTAYRLPPSAPLTAVTASSLWPTPTVVDMGERKTLDEWDDWTEEMQDRHGNGNGHGRSLSIEARRSMWPTPTSMDSKGSRGHRLDGTKYTPTSGLTLTDAVQMWATPIARDSRTFKGARRSPNSQGSEPLVVQVGGTLNPTWVEWLMGFPTGWTDSEPSATP